ncbi:MAG: MFS transporter, partial [Actinomycetota bacterium]|nr:MFS transporter [Actinomycetota bacterium]
MSQRLTLVATVLGSSLAFIDATVVNVALPTIERDFQLGLAGAQWVVLSYSLALASLYLLGGALGDRLGRRRIFVIGTIAFALASAVAGAAPNAAVLLVGRTLQGVAGALLTPSSLGLLRATFGNESGRAIGVWSAWTGIATVAGPPAGGALVEWTTWRLIFLVNLPLAAVTVALTWLGRCGERAPETRTGRFDVPGAVLVALGLGALTYGLVEAGRSGFDEATVWLSLAAALVALVAFVAVELRSAEPMLPFELFRRRNFSAANAETFLVYAALTSAFFYVGLYLQTIGFTPFATGLLLAPPTLILFLLAARFGRAADRRGPRLLLAVGPALMAVGMLLFLVLAPGSGWPAVLPGMLVLGLGLAMTVAPITATALTSAPDRHSGLAAGINSTISRIGGLIAVAVVGLVIAVVFDARTDVAGAVALAKDQHGTIADASTDAFRAGIL